MPASCSFKTEMICSSLNLMRFIPSVSLCVGLYPKPVTSQGSTSRARALACVGSPTERPRGHKSSFQIPRAIALTADIRTHFIDKAPTNESCAMTDLRDAKIWLAYQPVRSGTTTPLQDSYTPQFKGAQWQSLDGRLDGFKIFSGSIYKLADYGYSPDLRRAGYWYPTAARELIEMLRDISRINGWTYNDGNAAAKVTAYMESPVLMPGVLPNGAVYNHNIEGFDGSFLGVIGYIRNSLHYARITGLISLDEIRSIGIKYIAMDEPLFFASVYKTPTNFVVDGVRIQSPEFSIDEVARRAASALAQAKAILGEYDPGLRFGDIEPLPFVTPTQVDQWVKAFEREALAAGVKSSDAKLAFFQADVVWGVQGWEQNLSGISTVLVNNGVPLNIIINGNGSETDGITWTDNALNALIRVIGIPNLVYQSLSVQSWHWHLSIPLVGASSSLTQPGTIAHAARYVPALNEVQLAFARNPSSPAANPYELYTLTRMIATDDASVADVTRALDASTQIRDGLAQAVQSQIPTQGGKITVGTYEFLLPASVSAIANNYAPSGLLLESSNYSILPAISNADFYLKNVAIASRIGNLYLVRAPGQSVILPTNIAVTITALDSSGANDRVAVLGGARAGYSFLSQGDISYTVGSSTENVVDATGTGNSVITASVPNAGATVRGVGGTTAQYRIVGSGQVLLSPSNENVRVYVPAGTPLDLQGGRNIQIVVEPASVGSVNLLATSIGAGNITAAVASTIKTYNKSQSILNTSKSAITVEVPSEGASAVYDGGTGGLLIVPGSGGTIFEDPGSRNATYVIRHKTALTLNSQSGSLARFEMGSSGSTVRVKSSNPTIAVVPTQSVAVVAPLSMIGARSDIDGGGRSTMELRGGGRIEVGTYLRGFSRISVTPDGIHQPLYLTVAASSPQTELSLGNRTSYVFLNAAVRRVVAASTNSMAITANAEFASSRLEFGPGGGSLSVSTGGVFQTNISGRATVELNAPSTVYLNLNAALRVVVPASNLGVNGVGITAAGQKISILNGKHSVVYSSVSNVGVGTGTEIRAGGSGQLNLYFNGRISLGRETTGVREIHLHRDTTGRPLSLKMSDFQATTKVLDVSGGSTIIVSEKTQEVQNIGGEMTLVLASGADASLKIDGGKAGAILDVGDSRNVVLSDQLYNVLIKASAGAKIDGAKGQLVSFDLSGGSSEVILGSVGQTVRTGVGNTATDKSGGQITIVGTLLEWDRNVLSGVGKDDVIRILNVNPNDLSLRMDVSRPEKVLQLSSGSLRSSITFTNPGDWDRAEIIGDNAGGAYLRLI
jgi:hypothetical protein